MEFPKGLYLGPFYFFSIYMISQTAPCNILDVHLFRSDEKLTNHEMIVNGELVRANDWMTATKLTLKVPK